MENNQTGILYPWWVASIHRRYRSYKGITDACIRSSVVGMGGWNRRHRVHCLGRIEIVETSE